MAEIERHFVQVDGRLVHYRRTGSGPVLLILHQSPRDGGELLPLMQAMAPYATVVAPDTPGFGLSDPLPEGPAQIDRFAQALDRLIQALGLKQVALYGLHTGGCIACRFATLYPHRVSGLVVDGFLLLDEAERADLLAHYLPPITPRADGGHLAFIWHRIRDQGIFFPWYRPETAARLDRPRPDPVRVHQMVMELMRAGDHYRTGYGAALAYCPADDMAGLRVPALLFAAQDDILVKYLSRLPPLSHPVEAGTAPDRATAWERIAGFLRRHLPAQPAPPPPACAARGFHQGLAWSAGGHGPEVTLLLHDVGGTGRLLPLPETGRWLAIDMPGMGDSLPVVDPGDIHAVAGAIADLLMTLHYPPMRVAGWGYGARVALMLARRHPALVKHTDVVTSLPPRPLCLLPTDGGGHLLAAWQQARDRHLFGPGPVTLPDPDRLQEEAFCWLLAAPVLDAAWQAAHAFPMHAPAAG